MPKQTNETEKKKSAGGPYLVRFIESGHRIAISDLARAWEMVDTGKAEFVQKAPPRPKKKTAKEKATDKKVETREKADE